MILCFQFVFLAFFFEGTLSDVHYVQNGKRTCLKCAVDDSIDKITWLGPPNDMAYAVGQEVDMVYPFIEVNVSNNRSELCISKVSNKHLGTYTCYGSDLNNRFRYNVTEERNPTNMTIVNSGQNGSPNISEDKVITFNCSITLGDPIGKLQWVLDNDVISYNYSNNLQLKLRPTTADNGNVYICQAFNQHNEVILVKNTTITVYGRPIPPTFHIQSIFSTSITIQWQPGYNGGHNQTFVVQYCKHLKNTKEKRGCYGWKNVTIYDQNCAVLRNLSHKSKYTLRMFAFNRINHSNFTHEINVTTRSLSHGQDGDSESSLSGYIAFVSVPVIAVVGVAMYYFIRRQKLCETVLRCLKVREEIPEQNVVDIGLGAIANDMYGNPPNTQPRGQNDELQVYSSFDRRHNITLSTHAHDGSYDVRPKPRPDRTRKKKSKARGNNVFSTQFTEQNNRTPTETPEPQELNYVDVAFNQNTENSKLRIHGKQQKTEYVDIDFTKKLRNLPKPKAANDDNDDDFETACEVNKVKRKTKLQ